jgi:hypothetical protein
VPAAERCTVGPGRQHQPAEALGTVPGPALHVPSLTIQQAELVRPGRLGLDDERQAPVHRGLVQFEGEEILISRALEPARDRRPTAEVDPIGERPAVIGFGLLAFHAQTGLFQHQRV